MNNNLKIFNNNIDVYFQIITEELSKTNWISELWKYVKIQWWYSFKASEYKTTGIPIIRISDFNNWKVILDGVKYYEENSKFNDFLLNSWDIIIAMTGWTIWKLAIVQENLWKLYLNQRVWRFQILEKKVIYNEYLYWIARWVENIVKNMWYWWAQPNVSWKQIESIKFVFPKIEVQKNIVSFLNDLKDWKLENKEYFNKDTEELILNLHSKSLDIDSIWVRSQENLSYIKQLKQAILQEAIEWKLTKSWRENNPNTESASILLEKIQKEKEELVKQKKLKKQEKLKKNSVDEIPFEIPENWSWCRLGEICQLITKWSSPTWQWVNYVDKWLLFITSENVWNYNLILNKLKYVEEKFNEIEPRSILKKWDILMNIVWGSIGRTAIYNLDDIANINQAVCLIRLINNLDKSFFLHFFNGNICINYMFNKQVVNARENLSMWSISNFLIPLPPLGEQKEIVKKVDEMLKFCDDLEKQSLETKENSENLMKSVLSEVFSR